MAVYGIRWNRAVFTTIAANRINHAIALLRNSTFPRTEYARLAAFLSESYSADFSSPPELAEWHSVAAQLRLELSHGWDAALQAAIFLKTRGVRKPFDLGVRTLAEFQPIADGFQNAALIRTLWTSSRAMSSTLVPGNYLVPGHASLANASLVRAHRARSAQV